MGLILCESRNAQKPLFIDGLGIQVYTAEELSYVIYNYPMLVLDDFVDETFIDFIQSELRILLPSVKMDKEELLLAVLNSSDYYSSVEIEKYKNAVLNLKKLPKHEYLLNKGSLLFELEEYGRAIEIFRKALEEGRYHKADAMFNFRIYDCIGNSYANLLDLNKAFEAYKDAFEIKEDKEILKKIYFLSKYENVLGKREELMNFLDDRVDPAWDEEYEKAVIGAKESEAALEIRSQLDKDSVKRHAAVSEILNNWKKNYRNMSI